MKLENCRLKGDTTKFTNKIGIDEWHTLKNRNLYLYGQITNKLKQLGLQYEITNTYNLQNPDFDSTFEGLSDEEIKGYNYGLCFGYHIKINKRLNIFDTWFLNDFLQNLLPLHRTAITGNFTPNNIDIYIG